MNMIGLIGSAKAGKDELAAGMTQEGGWVRLAFGDSLKDFFTDYIEGRESRSSMIERMLSLGSDGPSEARVLDDSQIKGALEVLQPHLDRIEERQRHHALIGHTSDPNDKEIVRPLWEIGGDIINPLVTRQYFQKVDQTIAQGIKVINTRVGRVHEGHMIMQRGGRIIECIRPGYPAVSSWERSSIENMRRAGLISQQLHNDGSLEQWRETGRKLAHAR